MLNQVVILGRIEKIDNNNNNIIIKNEENIIPCTISEKLRENIEKYVQIGDLVGVKGKIISNNENVYVNVEKITFLSSNKEEN